MRVVGALAILLFGAMPTLAQTPAPATPAPAAAPAAPAPKPATAAEKKKPPPPKPGTPRAIYDAMPVTDRIAIQADLLWTGNYNGIADGDFKDSSVAAVKAFQRDGGTKDTGILTPEEREALTTAARAARENVGWRVVNDAQTGARLGLPGKLVPQAGKSKTGSHWQSSRGEVQIDTFRETAPATLAAVYEQQQKDPARKVAYKVLRGDFFVISGLQGLKKFYMRAQAKGDELRGFVIYYDQAMEGIVGPAVVAMSNTFAAFPAAQPGAVARRKVEYATGVVVSTIGDIVTDREAIDGCSVIVVSGVGNAERVAEDTASGLALLRLYGVRGLKPLALGNAAREGDVTLVGIADPQTQSGNAAVTTARARSLAANLDPQPARGFAGAAVIDSDSGFAGLVVQKPQVLAGPASAAGASSGIVGADTVRRFLSAQGVSHLSGRASIEFAKDSVVRVICVRK